MAPVTTKHSRMKNEYGREMRLASSPPFEPAGVVNDELHRLSRVVLAIDERFDPGRTPRLTHFSPPVVSHPRTVSGEATVLHSRKAAMIIFCRTSKPFLVATLQYILDYLNEAAPSAVRAQAIRRRAGNVRRAPRLGRTLRCALRPRGAARCRVSAMRTGKPTA